MRPNAIVNFERFYILALLIGVAVMLTGWNEMAAATGPVLLAVVLAISVGLTLLLVLLISRRRSTAAKWILIVLFAIGLALSLPGALAGGIDAWAVAAIVQVALQAYALYLLFTPPAVAWLRGTDAPAASR
jgi:hypothetical protein